MVQQVQPDPRALLALQAILDPLERRALQGQLAHKVSKA